MNEFKTGDLVRLSKLAIDKYVTSHRQPNDSIGDVVGISKDLQYVYVIWHGRVSRKSYWSEYLEKVKPTS